MRKGELLQRILAHCRSVGIEPEGGFPVDTRIYRSQLSRSQIEDGAWRWRLMSGSALWVQAIVSDETAQDIARAETVTLWRTPWGDMCLRSGRRPSIPRIRGKPPC